MPEEKIALVGAFCVFKKKGSELKWFLVKNEDSGDWEIPRTDVRRGESSVRSVLRSTAEDGGMRAKVLEEVGRTGGATKKGGEIVTLRTLYYLMIYREGGEVLGFADSIWLEHSKALKKVASKRDNQMLKDAKALIAQIEAERGKKLQSGKVAEEEEEDFKEEVAVEEEE